MPHKVKSSVGAGQVLLAKWISGAFITAAVVVGVLVGILDGKPVIANGMYALALAASFACIATIHARHITRHAMACTRQAESHTDKKIKEVREHTDRCVADLRDHTDKRVEEIQRTIKFAGIYEEVDQYLQNREGRSN